MENFTNELLDVAKHHDDLRQRLKKAQEQTLMIAVHYPHTWADHKLHLKSLYLEKHDTYQYLVELSQEVSLQDIHHLIKS